MDDVDIHVDGFLDALQRKAPSHGHVVGGAISRFCPGCLLPLTSLNDRGNAEGWPGKSLQGMNGDRADRYGADGMTKDDGMETTLRRGRGR